MSTNTVKVTTRQMASHMSEPDRPALSTTGTRRRSIPLEVRQDDAARQRAAALSERMSSAHAHNVHVIAVVAKARAEREKTAEQAQIAAKQKLDAAEKRRRARIQYCEKRLRAMSAQRERVRLIHSTALLRVRTCNRRGCNGVLRDLQSAERRRCEFLRSRARTAAGLAAAAQAQREPCDQICNAKRSEGLQKSEQLPFEGTANSHDLQVGACNETKNTRNVTQNVRIQNDRPKMGLLDLSLSSRSYVSDEYANDAGAGQLSQKPLSPMQIVTSCDSVDRNEANLALLRRRSKNENARAAAGRRIAGYWLLRKARIGFFDLGLLQSSDITREFESTAAAIQTSAAETAARLALRSIGSSPRAARVLLSSILFALHHEHVIEDYEGHEQCVLFAARRLVLCLAHGSLPALAYAWLDWRTEYSLWRELDKRRIKSAIMADAVATEALRHAVNNKMTSASNPPGDRDAECAIWNEQIDAKQAQLQNAMEVLFGNAGAEQFQSTVSQARKIPDEYLAHEIMLDLDGFVARSKPQTIPEYLWSLLVSELNSNPPVTNELFRRMDDIAHDLNAMRSNSFPSIDRSDFDLDVTSATQFLFNVAECLRQSQAPCDDEPLQLWVRDAAERLSNCGSFSEAVVSVLRELSERVREVRAKVVTARILQLAPYVKQYGAAWERSRFSDKIRSGLIPRELPLTKALLRETISKQSNHRSPRAASHLANTARKMLRSGLIALCSMPSAVNNMTVPEILSLDVARIVSIQDDVQKAALCAMLDNGARQLLATSYPEMRRAHTRYDSRAVQCILQSDDLKLESIQDAVIESVVDCLEKHNVNGMKASVRDSLGRLVRQAVEPGDVAFSLMKKRVTEQLEILLSGDDATRFSCDDAANTGQRALRGRIQVLGLGSVKNMLEEVAVRLERLSSHTYDVHGEYIVGIVSGLVSELTTEEPHGNE